jgi:hypothetical protein
MSKEGKILLLIGIVSWAVAIAAIYGVKKSIDYAISKSCAESQAFKIKNTHYMCIEIEERKK